MNSASSPGKAVNRSSKPLVLFGLSGVGKTTVAAALQRVCGWRSIDIDALIETEQGRSISEIIRVEGEPGFRDLEADALERSLKLNPEVISIGGGALMRQANADLVAERSVGIWLDAADDVLAQRVVGEQQRSADVVAGKVLRPLLEVESDEADGQTRSREQQIAEKLAMMRERRSEGFASAATVRVLTDLLQPEQIAEVLAALRGELDAITRTSAPAQVPLTILGDGIATRNGNGSLRTGLIVVGSGLLGGVLRRLAGEIAPDRTTAVVMSDAAISESWAREVATALSSEDSARHRVELLNVPSGEPSKAFANVGLLGEELLKRGIYRRDLFVAVGGGVVGDLGGLVASLYMRGLPLIHVPTTLVAQVDSAIGGKTAVNLPTAKNVLGTFYPGRAVIQDVRTLSTLPEREYRSGFAEVVKYGLLYDPRLITLLEANIDELIARSPGILTEVIVRCARMKATVVATDVEDLTGVRSLLNLGHTVGHAIENLTGYGTYLHGEAISIGLQNALWLSYECLEQPANGFLEQVFRRTVHLLKSFGLPTAVPEELMRGASEWLIRHHSAEARAQRPASAAQLSAAEEGSEQGSRERRGARGEVAALRTDARKTVTGPATAVGDEFRERWSSPMLRDKKRSGADTVSFVLLEEIGKPYTRRLTMEEILRGIASSPLNTLAGAATPDGPNEKSQ